MKRLSTFCILVIMITTSCQTSSDLGSTSLIQKKRYSKGFNLNVKKPSFAKNNEEKIQKDQSISAETITADANESKELTPPIFNLESEAENERDLASASISKTLLEQNDTDAPKADNFDSGIHTASPMEASNAFPLEIKEKNRRINGPAAVGVSSSGAEVTLLIIILTILLPPLGVGLVFGIQKEFWISLLLTILFYFPGLIYSLFVILA